MVCASRRWTRRSALRAARITAPILVLYPIPPALGPRGGAPWHRGQLPAIRASSTALLGSCGSARRPGTRRLADRAGGRDRPRAVAASHLKASSRPPKRSRAGQAVVAGLWTHLQAPEDPERDGAPAGTVRGRGGDPAGSGSPPAGPSHRSQRGPADRVRRHRGPRRRAARAGRLRPRARRAERSTTPEPDRVTPSTGAVAPRAARSASRTCPRGGGSATARHSRRRGPAGSRRCRSATATAGRARCRTGPSALVRGHRVPLVGNVAMDAVMADVTDVPGAPVTTADRFMLIGRQGAESITVAELAQARTTNSWEVVTGMARRLPRVYHAATRTLGSSHAHRVELIWLESSSGTAISAISRST